MFVIVFRYLQGKQAEIKLSIDGPEKDMFAVHPSLAFSESVVQLMVKNIEELDFERKKEMVIQVTQIASVKQ